MCIRDRDVWDSGYANYYRVVDYKTGKKDFDYCDVFNGVGLQMLLYLFALKHSGSDMLGASPVPAGVQYFGPGTLPVSGWKAPAGGSGPGAFGSMETKGPPAQ